MLADEVLHVDWTQPSREPIRLDHGGIERLPGRIGPAARGVRHDRAGTAGQRLQHVLGRQEPQRARGGRLQWRQQVGVAAAEGLRPVLWLPRRRDQSVVSGPGRGQPVHRSALRPRGGLPPIQGSCRPGAEDAARPERHQSFQALVHVVLPGCQPCPAPRGRHHVGSETDLQQRPTPGSDRRIRNGHCGFDLPNRSTRESHRVPSDEEP